MMKIPVPRPKLSSLLGLIPLTAAATASASTPTAWLELQRKAERACIERSLYQRPRVSNPIIFSDSNGKLALLVSGSLRQRGRTLNVTGLCLFDRRTGKADIEDADGWSSSRR